MPKFGEMPKPEEQKLPEETTGEQAEVEVPEKKESEKYSRAEGLLMELFAEGQAGRRGSNPFEGGVSKKFSGAAEELREIFKDGQINQKELAAEFFNNTIGRDIRNNGGAYKVYGLLKGTEFADTFRELESQRLKEAGFGEFKL